MNIGYSSVNYELILFRSLFSVLDIIVESPAAMNVLTVFQTSMGFAHPDVLTLHSTDGKLYIH